jgi:hypothetical protein
MSKTKTQVQKGRPATFADFKPQVYEFELENEVTGETLLIQARSLDALERAQILLFSSEPRPPEMKIHNVGGEMLPQYDYYNLDYRKKRETWGRERDNLLIIHTLVSPEIPGDTEAEKIETLNSQLAPWVREALLRVVVMLSTVAEGGVKRRQFRSNGADHSESV